MAEFSHYAVKLWDLEGGYVNHPKDKGGRTNRGVTEDVFLKYFPGEDIRELTFCQFWEISRKYWDRWRADEIENQSIAELLVDFTYHSGSYGVIIPQRVLMVKQDGIVGEKTLKALKSVDKEWFFNEVLSQREEFLRRIARKNPSQKVFLNGWMNRLRKFAFIPMLLLFISCAPREVIRYVRDVSIKIERDTVVEAVLIPFKDSVTIVDTVSVLENKYARTSAKWENSTLTHTLEIKPTPIEVKTKIIERVDSIPYEVERIKEVNRLTSWQKLRLDLFNFLVAFFIAALFFLLRR